MYKRNEINIVVALKSVVQPELHQTSQTGHLGDTSDRRSVQGAYLENQKDFVYEINFSRSLTHQGFSEAWNFNKISTDQKVMNFTNWRFSSPCSCEYQPLEVDFSPTMKWNSPETAIGFKTDVKPGDHLNHLEDIQDVLSCTSTQRIMRILIYLNLPYLESLAITLQQLLPKQIVYDFSTYQASRRFQEALISTQTVQVQEEPSSPFMA
ncbi:hypothetical protein F2Q69_00019553 [Brassica cretica]|uniref:Uncharacterized protein n=1 Tax=Brassica cretica TaxID=69181 RepID=A0A8S9QNA3_BRACR|nr:hypothetical protein F2Q69_00019553 [Brassica cretica]